ncbi:MAG: hypothetical protein COC16_01455 [Lutibacter sp.]|nr:MAG: hypothetical protein COC16_01455 [Lutibacter sp.]
MKYTLKELEAKTKQYKLIWFIHTLNYNDFQNILNENLTNEKILRLAIGHNSPSYNPDLINISRHFHNYISTYLSLTDHTRIIYRKLYEPYGFLPEYQGKVDMYFKNHKLSVFVKDLRQYIQHYKLPYLTSQIKRNSVFEGFSPHLLIEVEDLLEFSSWNKLSKEFINENPDGVDLLLVVKTHYKHTKEFYDWFFNEI